MFMRRRFATRWYYLGIMSDRYPRAILFLLIPLLCCSAQAQTATPGRPIVLHAARLLDIEAGRIVKPGEVLVRGERIAEAGSSVTHPAGVEVIDLGDATLMPGLIDAHIHL